MPTRYLGASQGHRGKLTRAKWRTLAALSHGATVPDLARPQTIRSLLLVGLIQPTSAGRYALTLTGRVAVDRYVPRRRSAFPLHPRSADLMREQTAEQQEQKQGG